MAVLRDRPYHQFNFLVDLGTGDTEGVEAGFSECSPIEFEVAVAEYRNGNDKENAVRKLTGLQKVRGRHAQARGDRLAEPLPVARRDPQRRPERAAHRAHPAAERGPHRGRHDLDAPARADHQARLAGRSTPRAATSPSSRSRSPTSAWRSSERRAVHGLRLRGRAACCRAPAQPLCEAAFCECEGLELRLDDPAACARAATTRTACCWPARGRVVRQRDLRRGMTRGSTSGTGAERVLRGQAARADARHRRAVARSRAGARALSPVPLPAGARSPGPRSDAAGNDIAIESLELACEGLDIVRPGDKPLAAAAEGPVAKAQLHELDASFEREINPARGSRSRSTRTSCGRRSATSRARRRAWSCELPRVESPAPRGRRAPDDVRRLTERGRLLRHAARRRAAAGEARLRLAWGTFQFDGHVEALEETLEAFSPTAGRCGQHSPSHSLAPRSRPTPSRPRPAPGAADSLCRCPP